MEARRIARQGREEWCVNVPKSALGERRRFFGPTRETALLRAESAVREYGSTVALGELPAGHRAVAVRWCDRMTADEVDTACREYHARKGQHATAADVCADYLAAPRETPLSDVHLRPLKVRLGAFTKIHGKRPLGSLTAGEMSDFCRKQGRSSPNYFSALRALFKFAHLREVIGANPFDRLTKPELEAVDKPLLTPDQMRRMIRIAAGVETGICRTRAGEVAVRHEPLLRLLILGGMCGLRHSEAMRQKLEEIDRESWEVHVEKMKTAKRGIRERYVMPEQNGKAWLQWLALPAVGPAVDTTERNIRERRERLCEAIGLDEWPDNGLRRSFASYHLAAFTDAARTAEILGHTDAETTKAKYRVARKKSVALAWFELTPETVLA